MDEDMNTVAKPRMSKEEIQQIIDSRLAVILEKELQQNEGSEQDAGTAASSGRKASKSNRK
jgi:hypothetical protein